MTPSQVDDLAAGLHGIICGGPPERWQQAMPATQERYRQMVRYVVERAPAGVPPEAMAARNAAVEKIQAQQDQIVKLAAERDAEKARAGRAELDLRAVSGRLVAIQLRPDARDERIAALEKVVEAARNLLDDPRDPWVTHEKLRDALAALDAAQPKDGWLARSVARAERDGSTAKIGPGDEPLYIPSSGQPDRTPSTGPDGLAVAPELSGCYGPIESRVPFEGPWMQKHMDALRYKPVERLKPRVIPEPDEPRIIRCSGGNCCTGIGAAYCECLCHVVDQLRADVTTVALIQRQDYDPHSGVYADLTDIIQRGEKARET